MLGGKGDFRDFAVPLSNSLGVPRPASRRIAREGYCVWRGVVLVHR